MRRVIKEVVLAAQAGEIIFELSELSSDMNANFPHNFFDIVSLDGLAGTPVVPTAGTYTTVVETSPEGGFKAISDGGTINANVTGGTASGVAVEGGSFTGNPNRLKITAAAVDVAAAFRVTLNQNSA